MSELEELEREIAELKNWKKEVIAVENDWDEQLIGKELNIQLGNSIRANILPKINELQAKIEEKDREVAELKGEKVRHDQLVDYLKAGIAEELEQRILELQASNHDLREAIRKIEFEYDYCSDADMTNAVKEAMTLLAKTPAESLQSFENEVIERCARHCERVTSMSGRGYAEAIRAWKGKQDE